MVYYFTGIDPGLVHTGVVMLGIDPKAKELHTDFFVVDGTGKEPSEIAREVYAQLPTAYRDQVFVESYRGRANNFSTNPKMQELCSELARGRKLIDNMGAKKLVPVEMLKVFGWQRFPGTNHADLRSAARILLLAVMQANFDIQHTQLLYRILNDYRRGTPWRITS